MSSRDDRSKPTEVAAYIVAALMKGGKTAKEIADLVYGKTDRTRRVMSYIQGMQTVGVVRIAGKNQYGMEVFQLQTSLFAEPDTPHVRLLTPGRRYYRKQHEVNGEHLTTSQASVKYGVEDSLLRTRLARGMTLQEAVNTPVRQRAGSKPGRT